MSKLRNNLFGSPHSIDLIEPNLYLGSRSAAEDVNTLKKYNITHILTIENIPLADVISKNKNFTTKYISLDDQPREDLLIHFDDTFSFISDGLCKGCVLVHCFMGVSRSASTVIAFIMKKYQLTFEKAFKRVQRQRTEISPNRGFIAQLKLYEKMGYKINPSHASYKKYMLQKVADQVRNVHAVPLDCMDIIQGDPGLSTVQPEVRVYCCKKCNRVLADETNLIPHQDNGEDCKESYFVMPIAWMNTTKTLQKQLQCPKCKSEVGAFNWISGIQCPCDVKQTPAFCLDPARVDFVTPSRL